MKVGVFFELQKINTLSGEGELMLTILSAFAQAESEDLRAQQMETLVSEGPVTCCSPALIQRTLMEVKVFEAKKFEFTFLEGSKILIAAD